MTRRQSALQVHLENQLICCDRCAISHADTPALGFTPVCHCLSVINSCRIRFGPPSCPSICWGCDIMAMESIQLSLTPPRWYQSLSLCRVDGRSLPLYHHFHHILYFAFSKPFLLFNLTQVESEVWGALIWSTFSIGHHRVYCRHGYLQYQGQTKGDPPSQTCCHSCSSLTWCWNAGNTNMFTTVAFPT